LRKFLNKWGKIKVVSEMLDKIKRFFGIRTKHDLLMESMVQTMKDAPLGLHKSMTSDLELVCKKCNDNYPLIAPMLKYIEDGVINVRYYIGDNNKVCSDCKIIYLDLAKKEYWVFEHNWWKKVASDRFEFARMDGPSKMDAIENSKMDLDSVKDCSCGSKLKEIGVDFPCFACDGKAAAQGLHYKLEQTK
jgi:hypothetical protein